MILNDYVEINITNKNIKYFKNLGYDIYDNKIMVKPYIFIMFKK